MMVPRRRRERIAKPDVADVSGVDPTAGIRAISGVRVHDIGQGDSISVLSDTGKPFMQIDYGGRVGNPFGRAGQIDSRMPVPSEGLLMLSHWDEDHWCSASRGTLARAASWLVPRQTTSPRAVKFSTTLPRIHCVPERMVGDAYVFTTEQGDQIWWEKIAAAPDPSALEEDCNHTGIGISIVKHSPAQVILLPGDAPYCEVSHYWITSSRAACSEGSSPSTMEPASTGRLVRSSCSMAGPR
jgi:hypothetical protein